jgi:hypothetical protein
MSCEICFRVSLLRFTNEKRGLETRDTHESWIFGEALQVNKLKHSFQTFAEIASLQATVRNIHFMHHHPVFQNFRPNAPRPIHAIPRRMLLLAPQKGFAPTFRLCGRAQKAGHPNRRVHSHPSSTISGLTSCSSHSEEEKEPQLTLLFRGRHKERKSQTEHPVASFPQHVRRVLAGRPERFLKRPNGGGARIFEPTRRFGCQIVILQQLVNILLTKRLATLGQRGEIIRKMHTGKLVLNKYASPCFVRWLKIQYPCRPHIFYEPLMVFEL